MRVKVRQEWVGINLEAKPGSDFDLSLISKCLDSSIAAAEGDSRAPIGP